MTIKTFYIYGKKHTRNSKSKWKKRLIFWTRHTNHPRSVGAKPNKLSTVSIKIGRIMPKACAIIAITYMVGSRRHMGARTQINLCTRKLCVTTVIISHFTKARFSLLQRLFSSNLLRSDVSGTLYSPKSKVR